MSVDFLKDYGIDRGKGLKNCMDNVAFYQKILTMFLEDDCFARAKKAQESADYKQLFSCMHEMKGVSGNAALAALYLSTLPLVELLRGGVCADAAAERRLFGEVENAYLRTCEGIRLILAE